MSRQLWQCFNAKIFYDRILCSKGHKLSLAKDGGIEARRAERGSRLELATCQSCKDFECMGDGLDEEDRGWIASSV